MHDPHTLHSGMIACRLALDMMRAGADAMFPGEHFGARAQDMLLLCAAYVGHADKRPMTAGKIALFAGIPRPTAIRRLADLQGAGLLVRDARGRFSLSADRWAEPAVVAATERCRRLVHKAGRDVSKLDT